MPKFRMIHVDHYMCKPVIPFDDTRSEITGKPISKVPIIRIFGADLEGRKICLHVHGFYPYVAIQNPEPNGPDLSKKIVSDIEIALEKAVEENRRSRSGQANNNAETARDSAIDEPRLEADPQSELQPEPNEFNGELDADSVLESRLIQERRPLTFLTGDQKSPIHRIERQETFNYYGYHKDPEAFFKLYFYNPKMVKHLALVFEDCKVLGRFIPVFWAHLPYILLFFIDNNLRGMQFIEVEQLYWRREKAPPISDQECPSPQHESHGYADINPISTCELEADIRFEWIVNRQRFESEGNVDGLKELWYREEPQIGAPLQQEERPSTSQLQVKIERFEEIKGEPVIQIKDEPVVQIKRETSINRADSKPDIKLELQPSTSAQTNFSYRNDDDEDHFSDDEDQFSDDDDFLIEAIIKAESQIPNLKRQTGTKVEVEPESRLKQEIVQTTSNKEKTKPLVSDNSMIDGKSVVCSTYQTQSSTSSSRGAVNHEYQFLCLMSMELHVSTRGKFRPDPAFDPIEAIFYCIRNDTPEALQKPSQVVGMIITDPFKQNERLTAREPSPSNPILSPGARSTMSVAQKIRTLLHRTGLSLEDIELNVVDTELELIMTLVEVVKKYDPEILIGYEMEQLSWGYILERSNILNICISAALSRVSDMNLGNNSKFVESTFVQPIMFTGRMVFSTWRIIRHEINLNTCSYERIHHHALNERVPCFPFEILTKWFYENRNRWRVIDYYLVRVVGQMRILDKFDLIAKVSELARVYGTQFIDVITRGSQIGIESMMLRLAKLQNLTPLSPTVMQRNKMKAPEALPLVMEPETNIYYDPVVVLDFQSLYPSIVIAYNYCYSTCLGRISDIERNERHDFGCSQLYVEEDEIKRLFDADDITVAPCGVAFVKKNIRHGILPKMLSELIVTRAMVKDQMKKNMKSERPNRRLQRILDHRQHGLKMMANTTYGYTGASYTGRMPCVEIADSIVSKGRETLEHAIDIVEGRTEWGAQVIYGDTDSIFIQFKNCDRNTAFKRAYEMVDVITAANPNPIKMKFEKIYQPCVLQTKKRYCGFKYESPDQTKPEFEAKGIETVRRDCCPAAARMLEMALRIQFTTRDINQVKLYVQHQFLKIMSGKLSNIQDYIFARQYKPRSLDKSQSVFVPAWQITKRFLQTDPRAEPRLNERVPFVIIYGEPRTPLVNLAKTPMEVLENLSYRINADYYIQKIICPTLNRIFCTMKVDTLLWYKSMPRQNIIHRSHYLVAQKNQRFGGSCKQSTMSQYFSPSHCPVCAKSIPISDDICDMCRKDLQSSVIRLTEEISKNQRKLFAYHQICRACSSLERNFEDNDQHHNWCISYDCQNLFRYHQAKLDALNSNFLAQILKGLN